MTLPQIPTPGGPWSAVRAVLEQWRTLLQAGGIDAPGISLFKGTVPTSSALPTPAPDGDAYLALNTQRIWVRSSGTWVDAGPLRTTTEELPPGSPLTVLYNYTTSTWPNRPTQRTDITVIYVGGKNPPTDYIPNVDLWDKDVTL